MSEVWERRAWRETRGFMACCWCEMTESWPFVWSWCWCWGTGNGRLGMRPSSIRGMRSSMASADRRGKGEKRRG